MRILSDSARETMVWCFTSIFALCLGAVAASAQEDDSDSEELIEEILVTGYRASIMDALAAKRAAAGVVDVVSSVDIGKLPDSNAAEALQRVPGITIQRQRGQGERISIRGLPDDLNLTLFNNRAVSVGLGGGDVVRSFGGILAADSQKRSFNFNSIPSELIGRITVTKSPSADTVEGGVGGVVNIETLKPFDLGELVIAGKAGMEFSDVSGENNPSFSGLISNVFADGKVGASLSASYSARDHRNDSMEIIGWEDHDYNIVDSTGAVVDTLDDVSGLANVTENVVFDEQERLGVNGILQFQPNDDLVISLESMITRLESHIDHDMAFFPGTVSLPVVDGRRLVTGIVSNGNPDTDHPEPARRDNGAVDYVELSQPWMHFINFDRVMEDDAYLFAGNIDWNRGAWTIEGDVSFSKSNATFDVATQHSRLLWSDSAGASFTFNGLNPVSIAAGNGVDFDAVAANELLHFFSALRLDERESTASSAQLDFAYDISSAWVDRIKFGARYAGLETDIDGLQGSGGTARRWEPYASTEWIDTSFQTGGGFLSGVSGNFPRVFGSVDSRAITAELVGTGEYTFGLPNPGTTVRIDEDVVAAYVMAEFDGDWGSVPVSGNFGVRYVATDHIVEGFSAEFQYVAFDGNLDNVATITIPTADPIAFTKDYSDTLPSLNINFELKDDLILRLAAAKVMARPEFRQMSTAISVNARLNFGNAGNPNVDPYRAWQYDASLEWYYNDASALTAAVFIKDIDNFIVGIALDETIPGVLSDPPPAPPVIELDSAVISVTRPRNGGQAEINGIELAWQHSFADQLPAPWDGLGFIFNYTYTDSTASFQPEIGITGSFPFPGLSKNAYNGILYYEKDKITARLAYNYRDEYLANPIARRGNRLYNSDYGQLDASFAYDVTDNLSVYVDAINLTNEDVTSYADVGDRLSRYTVWGRDYNVGIRGRF